MKKIWIRLAVLALLLMVTGCGAKAHKTKKLQDLEGTILDREQIPEELGAILEERKAEAFKLTFRDEDMQYLCIGYGRQPTGGYSISLTELYETENAVYVHTNLLGPAAGESGAAHPSYPYIVIRLQKIDKTVVFA